MAYVRIYQGEAYGWCAEKGEANTECPEALLVSLTGDIFEAVGGDKLKGAKNGSLTRKNDRWIRHKNVWL
ncbi:hypothetical protein [Mannheimia haemolytica]|uniref:hypothetical protein n=1 Tax=Mannheimia haemolytica TaxID=75985 RepID=UPI001EFEF400|nr:hypothetical protein [Mannheimia haemolytica]ULX33689.1 hypothetical protein H1D05_08590 [Mannheimia haemolytica]ULX42848.1 hypothetical protein H1D01_02575 [Mannheimia haemolytica]